MTRTLVTGAPILPHALPGFIAWVREQVLADGAAAVAAGGKGWKLEDHPAQSAMVLERDGGEIVVYNEGAPSVAEAAHMVLHDPLSAIEDCDIKLAILDTHKMVVAKTRGRDIGPGGAERIWKITEEDPTPEQLRQGFILSPGDAQPYCRECRAFYPCRTVRLLASGYSRRPGYEDGWEL